MKEYVVMKKTETVKGGTNWRIYGNCVYKSRDTAQNVIQHAVTEITMKNMTKAVRLNSAIRGVNKDKFQEMMVEVRDAPNMFKIRVLEVYY